MGGGVSYALFPLLTLALIELEILSQFWKALIKSWRVIYIHNAKNHLLHYILKMLLKIKCFVIYKTTRNEILPLSFSNAHSEAGMYDIATIQDFSGVLSLERKSQLTAYHKNTTVAGI